jgi:Arc/MetJ-type ribon-helix-helix transcriptional regulator
MQTKQWQFRLPEDLKKRMQKAVNNGLAENLTDLCKKAIENFLDVTGN